MFRHGSYSIGLISVLSFVTVGGPARGAEPPEVEWERWLGPGISHGDGTVQPTTNGGFIAVGERLIRTDSEGNIVWAKTYDGPLYPGSGVRETADGGFIVGGSIPRADDLLAVRLFKTDGDGELLWEWIGEREAETAGFDVVETSDGGYVVAGRTAIDGPRDRRAYLAKTDGDGDLHWEEVYDGDEDSTVNSVQETRDGNLILAGTRGDSVYLVLVSGEGELLRETTFPRGRPFVGKAVREMPDGGFVVVGFAASEAMFVLRTGPEWGDVVWEKLFAGAGTARGCSVVPAPDGGVVAVGWTIFRELDTTEFYMVRTDPAGELVWEKVFGTEKVDRSPSLALTSAGDYVVFGTSGPRSEQYLAKLTERPDASPLFRRGDSDGDGQVVLSDSLYTLNWLFLDGDEPGCRDAADVDDDGRVTLSDPIFALNWLFLDGRVVPAPGAAACGRDPTRDSLSCESQPACGGFEAAPN